MFTYTRSTMSSNRKNRVRVHGGCAEVSIEELDICWKLVGKKVVAGWDVKGAGDVV